MLGECDSSLAVQLAQVVLKGSWAVKDVQQLAALVWEPVLAHCEKVLAQERVNKLKELWPTAL
jgi:hypothetical protein